MKKNGNHEPGIFTLLLLRKTSLSRGKANTHCSHYSLDPHTYIIYPIHVYIIYMATLIVPIIKYANYSSSTTPTPMPTKNNNSNTSATLRTNLLQQKDEWIVDLRPSFLAKWKPFLYKPSGSVKHPEANLIQGDLLNQASTEVIYLYLIVPSLLPEISRVKRFDSQDHGDDKALALIHCHSWPQEWLRFECFRFQTQETTCPPGVSRSWQKDPEKTLYPEPGPTP